MKLLPLMIIGILATAMPATSTSQFVRLQNSHSLTPQLLGGSISISTSPASVNLTLVPGGQSAVSSTITITYAVSLTVLSNFRLYASFPTTSALVDSAGDVIPSSAVMGRCPTGAPTSFTPFTASGPFSSGSSLLVYQTSSLAMLLATQTQNCSLLIDLTNFPQLPAGNYSGNLVVQAQAL